MFTTLGVFDGWEVGGSKTQEGKNSDSEIFGLKLMSKQKTRKQKDNIIRPSNLLTKSRNTKGPFTSIIKRENFNLTRLSRTHSHYLGQ